uniref:Uncharacterized protein n=1 Tax=Hyaloperonospora arabidopsidis (strain Emoy2) TaxID=559515 RepID=M4BDZ5_HYAAE
MSVGPAKFVDQRTGLTMIFAPASWRFALGGTTWSHASRSRSLFAPCPRWGLGILLASAGRDCGPRRRGWNSTRQWDGPDMRSTSSMSRRV